MATREELKQKQEALDRALADLQAAGKEAGNALIDWMEDVATSELQGVLNSLQPDIMGKLDSAIAGSNELWSALKQQHDLLSSFTGPVEKENNRYGILRGILEKYFSALNDAMDAVSGFAFGNSGDKEEDKEE